MLRVTLNADTTSFDAERPARRTSPWQTLVRVADTKVPADRPIRVELRISSRMDRLPSLSYESKRHTPEKGFSSLVPSERRRKAGAGPIPV